MYTNAFNDDFTGNSQKRTYSAMSFEGRMAQQQGNKVQRTRPAAGIPIDTPSRGRDTDGASSSKDALIEELLRERALNAARLDACEHRIEQLTTELQLVRQALIQLQNSRAPATGEAMIEENPRHVAAIGVSI